jgi:zinc protease
MKRFYFLIAVLFLLVTHSFQAQSINISGEELAYTDLMPNDTSVIKGKLDNGFTYYIKKNIKPENRAEIRLVVNAGSILEDDDQLGVAHFVEHMAFNGTQSFPKLELVDYLETTGMEFGADINASTSFDQTIYKLQVRTDSTDQFKTAFKVFSEWASKISFDPDEVDKERGVVIEEWRIRRGASARMFDQHSKVLFKNSRYSERLPIGTPEVITSVSRERIKDFYTDWYRPDLMAMIVVGDIDIASTEKYIQDNFSTLKHLDRIKERFTAEIPDHPETLVSIVTDKEATSSTIAVYYKQDPTFSRTINDFRNSLIESFFYGMLNQRLYELSQSDNPPFLGASAGITNLVRSKGATMLSAVLKKDEFESALATIFTEAERIKQFGFNESELERQKKNALRSLEVLYNERDKIESANFVGTLASNYLNGNTYPSIEAIYEIETQLVPGITIDEMNNKAIDFLSESNRVIVLSAPDDTSLTIPTKEDLLNVFTNNDYGNLTAYKDELSSIELLPEKPIPGKIIDQSEIEELDVKKISLSNGVEVYLKSTEFQNDQIVGAAVSPGGNSLLSNEDYYKSILADDIVQRSGVGDFNQVDLGKKLAGKYVSVLPFINEIEEGFQIRTSPLDIETMFQLIHLYFTSPRKDTTTFNVLLSQIETFVINRSASPNAVFSDTLNVTLTNYNYRTQPWTIDRVNELDINKSLEFYKDRFADASDFTFFFVGNFNVDSISVFIEKYLASLPSINRNENWRDVGVRYPEGVIKKKVYAGIEPKSLVNMNYTGDFDWSVKNLSAFRFMTEALQIKLREVIREDESGTYGVSVSGSAEKKPHKDYRISISFGCDPNRVDELTQLVFEQIDSLKNYGLANEYLTKTVEQQLNDFEKNLKRNGSWLSYLRNYHNLDLDPRLLLTYPDRIKSVTIKDIQQAAQKYFNNDNYVEVVIYPEEMKKNE